MASPGANTSSYDSFYQRQPPPPSTSPMAYLSPRSFNNDDYDPFEMRAEDEMTNPSSPQYPRASKSPSTPVTTQREVYTTAREISTLDTPAPKQQQQQHHHRRHHDYQHKVHVGEKVREKVSKNWRKRYGGRWTLSHRLHRVFLPRLKHSDTDPETAAQWQAYEYDEATTWEEPKGQVVKNANGEYEYRSEFHKIEHKFIDTAVYLSPTNFVPRRLVVQATGHVLAHVEAGADTGDWMRTRISGDVPHILTLSEWALGPLKNGRWWNKLDAGLRMLAISFPLQVMLAMPEFSGYDDADVAESYTDHPGYHWDWPKYATNVLDEAPGPDGRPNRRGYHAVDNRQRAKGPQKVVMRVGDTDEWVLRDATAYPAMRYVFISYSWNQFVLPEKDEDGNYIKDSAKIQRMAQKITVAKGYNAYWLDNQCMSKPPEGKKRSLDLDYDVYTMCDIVRGSALVVILLEKDSNEARRGWGARLWTLPEGMLAPGETLTWCHERANGTLHHDEVHKIEMTLTFWKPAGPVKTDQRFEDDWPIRTLAEHFSGVLPLTRLELLPSIINALAAQEWGNILTGHSDLAYAVMGFLHYRIERNEDDTLFQSLARLSLGNDSDHIIERMISILPDPSASGTYEFNREFDNSDLFRGLLYPDQFCTRVHDITPTCDVVGVAHEDDTVIIDNCRAIHIRWKGFSRAQVQRHHGMRKAIAGFFVAAGLWWLSWGLNLTIYWLPYWAKWANSSENHTEQLGWVVLGFLAVAIVLSTAAPFSVHRLFGGRIEKSTPNLVAFEGVLPLSEIEKTVFGNDNGRLTWSPSATPFCGLPGARHPRERQGRNPEWVTQPETQRTNAELQRLIPPGHHLFTLVDTGDLTVTIFSAERPPNVALLCGREGGMVRATLCSWRFENDCLYKETVIRVPSTVYESAIPKDWLKLCLVSQDRAKSKRARIVNEMIAAAKAEAEAEAKKAATKAAAAHEGRDEIR